MLPFVFKTQQIYLVVICWLGGFGCCLLFLQSISPKCSPPISPPYKPQMKESLNVTPAAPAVTTQPPTEVKSTEKKTPEKEKPILLLWFLPLNYKWDFTDCKKYYDIDDCIITTDRTLYNQAENVLIFHRDISYDLANLPKAPRPAFQRWIWFHVESPTNTVRIPGLENFFNLTMSYRRDADISVRFWLKINKTASPDFVVPKKDKLVCWFVTNMDPGTGTGTRMAFYNELKKYIDITVYGGLAGNRLPAEQYYSTMSSCKFYLSFENSIHKDYINEKVNGPFVSGTVPVVLGPPRQNYEEFYPADSFIHYKDYPNAEALAKYLHQLDKDDAAYRRYFNWRKHIYAKPHLLYLNQEFVMPICHACQYVARHKEYKAAKDIYKWWFDGK